MELFTALFAKLLVLVDHCFDGIVIQVFGRGRRRRSTGLCTAVKSALRSGSQTARRHQTALNDAPPSGDMFVGIS